MVVVAVPRNGGAKNGVQPVDPGAAFAAEHCIGGEKAGWGVGDAGERPEVVGLAR